jgi:hypothetical protein
VGVKKETKNNERNGGRHNIKGGEGEIRGKRRRRIKQRIIPEDRKWFRLS